jgi:hypothetical protein
MSLIVPAAALSIESDCLGSFTRSADSGRSVKCVFCSECGTRLVHEPQYEAPVVSVRAGTLDDTSELQPVAHMWLKSAQPWFELPQGMLGYDQQPTAQEFMADMKKPRS